MNLAPYLTILLLVYGCASRSVERIHQATQRENWDVELPTTGKRIRFEANPKAYGSVPFTVLVPASTRRFNQDGLTGPSGVRVWLFVAKEDKFNYPIEVYRSGVCIGHVIREEAADGTPTLSAELDLDGGYTLFINCRLTNGNPKSRDEVLNIVKCIAASVKVAR